MIYNPNYIVVNEEIHVYKITHYIIKSHLGKNLALWLVNFEGEDLDAEPDSSECFSIFTDFYTVL